MGTEWPRAILHVDMDAFFASVEQLDDPSLRGKPVIVGGCAEGRGVVSAASYEARVYGVHSAMPTATARRLCPHGVFLPVRGERYGEASAAVYAVFERFTPRVQPVSVDEAYLDVTGSQRLFGPPETIGRKIKETIRSETGLTASVGAAPNRFVAKLASDLEKPDGLVVIPAGEVLDRLAPLPVGRIGGVGKVMRERLARLGIRTIGELRTWPREALAARFGQAGDHLHALARGEEHGEVRPRDPEKSLSHETTFPQDVLDRDRLEAALLRLADKVAARLRRKGLRGGGVHLKLRYDDFSTVTRRVRLPEATDLAATIHAAALRLLEEKTEAGARPVRLIGVGVDHLTEEASVQGDLFAGERTRRTAAAERALDAIRDRFGRESIRRGAHLDGRTEGTNRADPAPPAQDASDASEEGAPGAS